MNDGDDDGEVLGEPEGEGKGVAKGVPVALGDGTTVLVAVGDGMPPEVGEGVEGVSAGVLLGVPAGVSVGISVGVGGRGMGDASYPLAVLGIWGEGEVGTGGLVAGEGEGLLGGLFGAGLVALGQR